MRTLDVTNVTLAIETEPRNARLLDPELHNRTAFVGMKLVDLGTTCLQDEIATSITAVESVHFRPKTQY